MVIMKYLIFQNPIIPFSNISSGWQKTPLLSSAMLGPLQEILVVLVNRCPPGLSQDTVRSGFLALHSLSILECPCLWALWYLPLPSLPHLWLKFPEMLQRNFSFTFCSELVVNHPDCHYLSSVNQGHLGHKVIQFHSPYCYHFFTLVDPGPVYLWWEL